MFGDRSLVDPRTGKTLASKRVKRTDGKYRFAIKAAITDLCRGDDGRTVQGGAKRTTEFQLQPFVDSKTGEMVLAATGSLRLNPNRRGDSVGCRDTTSEVSVTAEKLTKETRATVKQRLSPIPQPDLVPRPDFTVSIKGVRIGVLPGEGHEREDSYRNDGPRPRRRKSTAARSITAGTRAAPNVVLHQDVFVDIDWTYVADPFTGTCTLHWAQAQSANVHADRPLGGTLACATWTREMVEGDPAVCPRPRGGARGYLPGMGTQATIANCRSGLLRGSGDHQKVEQPGECGAGGLRQARLRATIDRRIQPTRP